MKKRIFALFLALVLIVTALPRAQAAGDPGVKIVYGYSGAGRELVAWRYGTGPNVMVLGFAIHGWEDNWDRDGEALVYTANKVRESLEASNLAAQRGWSVYVLPCMNPDGLYDGYTCNGPGRCTTTYIADGEFRTTWGIDMNRCFPTNFVAMYNDRNYTYNAPMLCKEAQALSSFIKSVKGDATNILMDIHGWYQQTIVYSGRSGLLYTTCNKHFPRNTYTAAGTAPGYLISYAHSMGYDACLLELPDGLYSMSAFKNSGYASDVVNVVNDLIKSKPAVCTSGHSYQDTRVEPTCGRDGSLTRVCSVCGDKQVSVLPATGAHNYEASSHTAPGCVKEGTTVYTCTGCGKSYTETQPALGHDFDPYTRVVVKPNTATRDGQAAEICSACGETKTYVLPRVFPDTRETYYSDAVDAYYARGIVSGMPDGTFGPHVYLDRATVVTFLYRVAGSPDVDTSTLPFTDVGKSVWFAKAVTWAWQNGIVYGSSATTFNPFGLATRDQTASILYRYAALSGVDMSARTDLRGYADYDQIPSYSLTAMSWCVANNILVGTTATTLEPLGYAMRSQAVVLLYRLENYIDAHNA